MYIIKAEKVELLCSILPTAHDVQKNLQAYPFSVIRIKALTFKSKYYNGLY